jgi:glycosyltransferase involved in cell wall biosynthesis
MRVLFVTHAYLPDSSAGVELYTHRLAVELRRRGHRPAIVTARQRPGQPQYAVAREEVHGLPVLGIVQNWPYRDLPQAVTDPAVDRIFDRLLEEVRPDLVSVQTLAHLSVGMLAVAARRGVPAVVHLHDAWWSCASGGQRRRTDGVNCLPVDPRACGACFDRYRHTEGPLERASRWLAGHAPPGLPPDSLHRAFAALPESARGGLKRLNERLGRRRAGSTGGAVVSIDPRIATRERTVGAALGSVARVLSPSRFLLDSLVDDGVELPSGRVLASGVPAGGAITPLNPDRGGPLRLLFLGTWVPHKGPQVLARALAEMTAPVEATGVGPAPFPAFVAEVERLSGGRLRCAGPVGADRVAGLIDRHEVVVIPSTWAENAPLVALEARARARPVVASNLGGLPELVEDGVDGRLFEAGDHADLARILADTADLRRLAASVRPPRELGDFVDDVEGEYLELVR